MDGADAAPCRERSWAEPGRPEMPFVVGSSTDSSSSVGEAAPLRDSIEDGWCSMDLCCCAQFGRCGEVKGGLTRGRTCFGGDVMACAAAADP